MSNSIRLKDNYLINDYANFHSVNQTITISNTSSYSVVQVPFNSNNIPFVTNNTNLFEKNTDYIKCKFKGKVLVIRNYSNNFSATSFIITDVDGWTQGKTLITIQDVNVGTNIDFRITGGGSYSSFTISNCELIVIKIA